MQHAVSDGVDNVGDPLVGALGGLQEFRVCANVEENQFGLVFYGDATKLIEALPEQVVVVVH